MADPAFASALHEASKSMWNITLIFLGAAILFFVFARFLYFKLIEQGWREKIIIKIRNSDIVRKAIWFVDPTSSFLNDESESQEIKKAKEKIGITRNDHSGQVIIKYLDDEIPVDGQRALIIWFFYNNQNGAKTFHDYNGWIKNLGKKPEDEIDFRVFRQEIKDINGRIAEESKHILCLMQKSQNNYKTSTKASPFKYRPEFSKSIK